VGDWNFKMYRGPEFLSNYILEEIETICHCRRDLIRLEIFKLPDI